MDIKTANKNQRPTFSGVRFINPESIAKAGGFAADKLMRNPIVQKFATNTKCDMFFRQTEALTEWKIEKRSKNIFSKLKLKSNPWIPILDEHSLTKNAVKIYLKKFIPSEFKTDISPYDKQFIKEMEAKNTRAEWSETLSYFAIQRIVKKMKELEQIVK